MTSTHASTPFRFTRSGDGYAVGHLPTLATGRHLGTVRKIASSDWTATTPDSFSLGDRYSTRNDAAIALLAVADRVAALDALPTEDDEPVVVRAGQAAPLAQHDTPRQDLDGEVRYDEQGNARYWTADEVAAERAEQLLDEVEARAEQQHADDEADRAANAHVLDDDRVVDDDPVEQPTPLDWSAIAAEVAGVRA